MIALGLDTGPSKTGAAYCRLENGWLYIDIGGHFENESPELARLIQRAAMVGAPIGIETIRGWAFEASRVQALVETARWEGRFHQLALGFGAQVLEIEARAWRGSLCGSTTASDKQIRIAIESLVKEAPKVRSEAREHLYDATGVAIAVLSRTVGRTLSATPEAFVRIHQLRAEERAGRTKRVELGLPAVKPTKRSPTRAQSKRRSTAAKAGWVGRRT